MARAARWMVAAPGAVLLGWMAIQAMGQAEAGGLSASASQVLERGTAIEATWRTELERGLQLAPRDPSLNELAALVSLRSNPAPDDLAVAERRLRGAIEARPGSAYTWAILAQLKYRLGDTGKAFESALVNAQVLGPYEPEVQAIVADYGLAVMDEVQPRTRTAVERALEAGMKRNAAEMLQIASRRGRLDAACRHFNGSTRPAAAKWIQLCQSMEAT